MGGQAPPVGPETVATTRYGNVFTAGLRHGDTVGLRIRGNVVGLLEGA